MLIFWTSHRHVRTDRCAHMLSFISSRPYWSSCSYSERYIVTSVLLILLVTSLHLVTSVLIIVHIYIVTAHLSQAVSCMHCLTAHLRRDGSHHWAQLCRWCRILWNSHLLISWRKPRFERFWLPSIADDFIFHWYWWLQSCRWHPPSLSSCVTLSFVISWGSSFEFIWVHWRINDLMIVSGGGMMTGATAFPHLWEDINLLASNEIPRYDHHLWSACWWDETISTCSHQMRI